ncbi:MAG TPA: hypothetical protein VFH29_08215, partial [Anaerolineales bacterium]|nr:hypothetical protein [Anaerolineales bacterium]
MTAMREAQPKRLQLGVGLVLLSLALAAATVSAQVRELSPRFIRVQQEKVHEQMLAGSAGNPWQYRILSDAMMEPLIQAAQARGIPAASYQVFVGMRFFQCLLIFLAAGVYFSRLSLKPLSIGVGLSILAWSMSLSLYNSDLSFSVFFDVAFYLLAAIFMLQERPWWIALLMLPAALNRETSLLIPAMLATDAYFRHGPGPARRHALMAAATALLLYLIVFIGLRVYYGPQPFL